MEESLRSFSQAVELDPNFARAYAGMSGPSAALGRQADAEKYIKLAMEHLDRMTERERYHTRAFFYLVTGDYQKCVEEYGTLVNQYPADRIGQADLAVCSLQLRNIPKAIEASRKAVEIVPNGVVQRLNLSFQRQSRRLSARRFSKWRAGSTGRPKDQFVLGRGLPQPG